MKIYARVWAALWWPVLAAAFLAGLVLVPLASFVAFSLIAGVLGGWSVQFDREPFTCALGWVRRAATRALTAALAMGAFACLIALLGAVAWPLLFLVAATSPTCLCWGRKRMSGSSPRLMTDRELCEAWRASTHGVRTASAAYQRLGLAALRQTYLDEMERRNSAGLRAWLETSPCADHDIDQFMVRGIVKTWCATNVGGAACR